MFDEFNRVFGTTEVLYDVSRSGQTLDCSTYRGRPSKAQTDCANQCALSGTIWAYDHVQVGSGKEFCGSICYEVGQFDSNNGTRQMATLAACGGVRRRRSWVNTGKNRLRCRTRSRGLILGAGFVVVVARCFICTSLSLAVVGRSRGWGIGSRVLVVGIERS